MRFYEASLLKTGLELPLVLNLQRVIDGWELPFFRRFHAVFESLGYEMSPIYRDLGIDSSRFDDLSSGVKGGQLVHLLGEIARRHNDSSVGIKLGMLREPKSLGYRFYIAFFSATLGEALIDFSFETFVYVPLVDISVIDSEPQAVLDLAYWIESSDLRYQSDTDLITSVRLIRALLQNPAWSPDSVSLKYQLPAADLAELENILGCPIATGCDRTALYFPRSLLEEKLEFADARMKQAVKTLHHQELDQANWSLTTDEKVNLYLIHHFRRFGVLADNQQVAEAFGLSVSSLNRQLMRCRTSYRTLRTRILEDLAKYYLLETEVSLEFLAIKLGYQNVTAFHRMFKQLTGISPAAIRRKHG
jgi:AraC-like DNA-binding protein